MSTTVSARFVAPATSITRIMATLYREFNVIRQEVLKEFIDNGTVTHAFQLARNEDIKTSFDMRFEIL